MQRTQGSLDFELHRLTTQTLAVFDETVGSHIESLKKELGTLVAEAGEWVKERVAPLCNLQTRR